MGVLNLIDIDIDIDIKVYRTCSQNATELHNINYCLKSFQTIRYQSYVVIPLSLTYIILRHKLLFASISKSIFPLPVKQFLDIAYAVWRIYNKEMIYIFF